MSLSPIIGAATQLLGLFGNHSSARAASSLADSSAGSSSSGQVVLSQTAQLLAKFQGLASNSPAQFKTLTADIASRLSAEAQKAGGSAQSFLSELANQFQTASQTGSASGLNLGAGQHHHGGGHHHSVTQAAYGQTGTASDAQSLLRSLTGL